MANKLYEENSIRDIAESLRTQRGTTSSEEKFLAADMGKKVMQLPRMLPFASPNTAHNEEKAAEIVAVANTWKNAVEDGRLTIVYQAGVSALHGHIKNDSGQYSINCSALVGLILRGISYEDSPYYGGDTSKNTARTDLYTWANPYYEKNGLTEANHIAEYAHQNGLMLRSTDVSAINPGDVLFFEKNDGKYFGAIWHVAIALEAEGKTCLHALSGRSSAIWTFDMSSPPNIVGTLKYIAKPQYHVDFKTDNGPTELKILEQPAACTVTVGENAYFHVKAQGDGLTYKWQYSKNNSSWSDSALEGYNTDTQEFKTGSWHTGQWYRCVITDQYGNSVTSNGALLTVTT